VVVAGEPEGFAACLLAARDGDAAAWSQLYHELAPLVIGYLRAQRLPDPEDVAGEVFLQLVRDLHRFDGDAKAMRSWVLAITHHRLLDARRRDQRRPAIPTATEDLPPLLGPADTEADALAAIAFGELDGVLRTLTDDQRTVLLLRVIADLSIEDVASVLGRRPGAIKQLQRRATAALRRELEPAAPVERQLDPVVAVPMA
jgi:RNA polymerase sigma factor (sigma-70 family)